MRLGDVRKDLENYDYCEIIFNLSTTGCRRWQQEYNYVYQLLQLPDDYEIPYKCYEVIYDWDDYGEGDGKDAVCFYSSNKGLLETDRKMKEIYGEEN